MPIGCIGHRARRIVLAGELRHSVSDTLAVGRVRLSAVGDVPLDHGLRGAIDRTRRIVEQHLLLGRRHDGDIMQATAYQDLRVYRRVLTPEEVAQVRDRAVIVRRIAPLLIEAVVRGCIAGSAWAEYQQQGTVCGMQLPAGLRESERLPEPIFTPSTKAPAGDHDLNISFEEMISILGGRRKLAEQVRDTSLRVYHESLEYALRRGIITRAAACMPKKTAFRLIARMRS